MNSIIDAETELAHKSLPRCCTDCMEYDNCKGATARECNAESKKRLKEAAKYAWGKI